MLTSLLSQLTQTDVSNNKNIYEYLRKWSSLVKDYKSGGAATTIIQWEVFIEGLTGITDVIQKELVTDIDVKPRDMDDDDDETYSSSRVQTEESKVKESSQSTLLD